MFEVAGRLGIQPADGTLWIGDITDCDWGTIPMVHACKEPCHRAAIGYSGNLDKEDPRYLTYREGDQLFLNMIDTPKALITEYTRPLFVKTFEFLEEFQDKKTKLLVHCNRGESRSVSLVMAYLANQEWIDNTSLDTAVEEFLFTVYTGPEAIGGGLMSYMNKDWEYLMKYRVTPTPTLLPAA